MDDLLSRTTEQENILQQLARKIPGFAGYRDRENRREADKLHREYMASRLTAHKGRLQDLTNVLLAAGGLDGLDQVDRVANAFDRVIERIRHASYGYAGFFDAIKIEENDLERVYQYDMGLMTDVDSIGEAVERAHAAAAGGDFKAALAVADQAVKGLDAKLDNRSKVMMGVS